MRQLFLLICFLSAVLLAVLACNASAYFGDEADQDFSEIDFPQPPSTSDNDRPALQLHEVQYWLYVLDVNLDSDAIEEIAASDYDMVVMDYIPSEVENAGYPMAQVIQQIKGNTGPKLVLAYIDIGEAESYRSYWQEDWQVGDPAWIAGEDPDGWQENYPVAFWHEEWQAIWLDPAGLIPRIVEAGFDGIYLDWVEAYSDENVLTIAREDGVDARQEMIEWVSELARVGREKRPDFLVVAQNAAELIEVPGYSKNIDAIAQEQVWFDGGADNEPQGDCPLPRTESEIDTSAYRDSLSTVCRRQFDAYPESTLHVSSEWYLAYLEQALDSGLVVFTVDYALDPANVAWIYEHSRDYGFVPFVSNRALDIIPFPIE